MAYCYERAEEREYQSAPSHTGAQHSAPAFVSAVILTKDDRPTTALNAAANAPSSTLPGRVVDLLAKQSDFMAQRMAAFETVHAEATLHVSRRSQRKDESRSRSRDSGLEL